MGREIRYVPEGWKHPRRENGAYVPLFPADFAVGEEGDEDYISEEDCMPQWEPEKLTYMMMYENTSEGTPISPAFPREDVEGLAQWLADNNASSFAGRGATKEQWLRTIEEGYGPCAIICNGVLKSGVEGF